MSTCPQAPATAAPIFTAIRKNSRSSPATSTRLNRLPLKEMSALHKALHIERVVIVTPSVCGTDNAATLFGMKARRANARGVAVIDDKTVESDHDAMQK